jgi:hypothetical protein
MAFRMKSSGDEKIVLFEEMTRLYNVLKSLSHSDDKMFIVPVLPSKPKIIPYLSELYLNTD